MLEASDSAVVALLGDAASRLTRYFFNALQRDERVRLDVMELFLPEDWVHARVRDPQGSFKPIEQGSIGLKSTAVLSLLLAAGDQPLVIDQPEDDLDNQYIYKARSAARLLGHRALCECNVTTGLMGRVDRPAHGLTMSRKYRCTARSPVNSG